jgi:tubulin-specific chaperone A
MRKITPPTPPASQHSTLQFKVQTAAGGGNRQKEPSDFKTDFRLPISSQRHNVRRENNNNFDFSPQAARRHPSPLPTSFSSNHPDATTIMVQPSPLAIATSSVQRLVKEESFYHKDQEKQEARIKKLEEDIAAGGADLDSNAEYVVKQEVRTAAPLPPSRSNGQQQQQQQQQIALARTHLTAEKKTALEETKKVFEPLRERIVKAVQTLEEQIAISESDGTAKEDELTKAREMLKSGRKVGGLEVEEVESA